jgi:hypothetical protein
LRRNLSVWLVIYAELGEVGRRAGAGEVDGGLGPAS